MASATTRRLVLSAGRPAYRYEICANQTTVNATTTFEGTYYLTADGTPEPRTRRINPDYGGVAGRALLDFRLRPGAAAIDRGVALPNLNDGFAGKVTSAHSKPVSRCPSTARTVRPQVTQITQTHS